MSRPHREHREAQVEKEYATAVKALTVDGKESALLRKFIELVAIMYPNPEFRSIPKLLRSGSGAVAFIIGNDIILDFFDGKASLSRSGSKRATVDDLLELQDYGEGWPYPWELTEHFLLTLGLVNADDPEIDKHRAPWKRRNKS